MNTTYISLVDCQPEPCPQMDSKERLCATFCDGTYQMKYQHITDRLVSLVELSENGRIMMGVRALWDTGSLTSCISKQTAEQMYLQTVDTMECITPTGTMTAPVYYVNMKLAGDLMVEHLRVTEYPLERHDVDFLIGMDIISRGTFTVENTGERTKVSFRMK